MKEDRIGIYVASPCGFCPESYKLGLTERIIPAIQETDKRIVIINPWDIDYSEELRRAERIRNKIERIKRFHEIDMQIGKGNKDRIDECRAMVAVLNGNDIDSGVAGEVVYAAVNDKPVLGYRDDFRPAGENEGTKINLQLQYFLELSGGWIINSVKRIPIDLRKILRNKGILE